MALDRIKGRIAFICDECQDGLETDFYELEEAINVSKEHGWRSVHIDKLPTNGPKLKVGVKYANICRDCLSEYPNT